MATFAYSGGRPRAEAPHTLLPFRISPPAVLMRTAAARPWLIA